MVASEAAAEPVAEGEVLVELVGAEVGAGFEVRLVQVAAERHAGAEDEHGGGRTDHAAQDLVALEFGPVAVERTVHEPAGSGLADALTGNGAELVEDLAAELAVVEEVLIEALDPDRDAVGDTARHIPGRQTQHERLRDVDAVDALGLGPPGVQVDLRALHREFDEHFLNALIERRQHIRPRQHPADGEQQRETGPHLQQQDLGHRRAAGERQNRRQKRQLDRERDQLGDQLPLRTLHIAGLLDLPVRHRDQVPLEPLQLVDGAALTGQLTDRRGILVVRGLRQPLAGLAVGVAEHVRDLEHRVRGVQHRIAAVERHRLAGLRRFLTQQRVVGVLLLLGERQITRNRPTRAAIRNTAVATITRRHHSPRRNTRGTACGGRARVEGAEPSSIHPTRIVISGHLC
ncbi:hypothetical protein [Streptomyces sp. NPDC020681]|uniref:hypothetical protein n=1 Tax=Streptomyces sp. NPDC020681 TaxID=3365083 RepID=UPI0037AF22D5